MQRKVIQLARKTLVVSLPIQWAKQNHIKKGDAIRLEERGTYLHLTAISNKPEIVLNLEATSLAKRILVDAYIHGYEAIRIQFTDAKVLKIIREEELMGFEMVEQGKDYCVLQNIASPLGDEFHTLLRRTFLLVKQMSQEEEVEVVDELERAVNRFTSYCKRMLNTIGVEPAEHAHSYYSLVRELEMIGDTYKYLVRDGAKHPYLKEVAGLLEQSYAIYYQPSKEKFTQFYTTRKALVEEGKALLTKDPVPASHGLDLVTRIYNLVGPMLTINGKVFAN